MKQKITTEIYVEDYKLTKVMTNNQKSQAFLSCNLTEIVTCKPMCNCLSNDARMEKRFKLNFLKHFLGKSYTLQRALVCFTII